MPKIVRLILTHDRRGAGRTEDDPCRLVPQLFTLDGELVCEIDSHDDSPKGVVSRAALGRLNENVL